MPFKQRNHTKVNLKEKIQFFGIIKNLFQVYDDPL